MDPSVVRPWLRSVVAPYALENRVFTQVDAVLQQQRGLRVATDVYTSDDGRSSLLIRLSGTLPVSFRSAQYNIPIVVWVPHAYPREPPLVYVEPTRGMAVRPGHPLVELDGRVGVAQNKDGPGSYLTRWERKWEASNLVDLMSDLQEAFGTDPPVYAVPAADAVASSATTSPSPAPVPAPAQAQAQSRAQAEPQPRPPPLPGRPFIPPSSVTRFSSDCVDTRSAPLPPPKPLGSAPIAVHLTGGSNSSGLGLGASGVPPSALHSPPRQESFPTMGQQPQSHSTHQPYPTPAPSPGVPVTQRPTHANSMPILPWHQELPASAHEVRIAANGTQGPRHDALPPPPIGTTQPAQHAFSSPPVPPLPIGALSAPGPAVPRDIMDEEDQPVAPKPAPARPPNPELLRIHEQLHACVAERINTLFHSIDEEARGLSALSDDLDRGQLAISDESRRLEAVRDVCRAHAERMASHNGFAVRALQTVQTKIVERLEGPDAGDDWIMATSIPGQQYVPGNRLSNVMTDLRCCRLIDLVTESNAIEDTMYQLSRAFNAETITLDHFLKNIRMLAREQFLKRALAMRIASEVQWN